MSQKLQPFDLSTLPELGRLADEVERTRRPLPLRRGSRDVALLIPSTAASEIAQGSASITDRSGDDDATDQVADDAVLAELEDRRRRGLGVAGQTAGIFARYAKRPPPTPREEKDAFEQAVAEQVMESMEG